MIMVVDDIRKSMLINGRVLKILVCCTTIIFMVCEWNKTRISVLLLRFAAYELLSLLNPITQSYDIYMHFMCVNGTTDMSALCVLRPDNSALHCGENQQRQDVVEHSDRQTFEAAKQAAI